jgi:hypothetical protein
MCHLRTNGIEQVGRPHQFADHERKTRKFPRSATIMMKNRWDGRRGK